MNSFFCLWFIVVILIVNTSQKAYGLDERDIEDAYSLLPRLLFDENDDVDNRVKRLKSIIFLLSLKNLNIYLFKIKDTTDRKKFGFRTKAE